MIQESLSVGHRTGALETKDLERVAVDTTVQPKAIAHPTDARLMHRALEKLVNLAKRHGVELRQSYLRVAKRAAIMIGRCAAARISSAATTSARSGACRGARRNFGNQAFAKSPGPMSTSIGISRNAGPGMPEVACRAASSMYSGMREVS